MKQETKLIDWEQRRWDLVADLFLRYPNDPCSAIIERVDALIGEYKEPFKTEEIV